jgi:hypothetical protein
MLGGLLRLRRGSRNALREGVHEAEGLGSRLRADGDRGLTAGLRRDEGGAGHQIELPIVESSPRLLSML